jgi:hypothetical protein
MRTLSLRTIKIHLGARKIWPRAIFFPIFDLARENGSGERAAGGAPTKLLPLLKSGCACACGVRWPPEDHNSGKKRKSAMILLWHSPNKTKSRPHLNELANFALGKSVFAFCAPYESCVPFGGCKIGAAGNSAFSLQFFTPLKCPADSLFLNLVEAVCARPARRKWVK